MIRLLAFDPALHTELLFSWRRQPDVARFMYSQKQITREGHLAWVAGLASRKDHEQYIIQFRGSPVGAVHLSAIDYENERADLGMYVAEEGARVMGAGAMAEILMLDIAFNDLSLNKISGEVFASNEAARRMHKRIGFKEEGVRRQHARFEGEWVDVHVFSILASEWSKHRAVLKPLIDKMGSQAHSDVNK